ncbi:MAG TPA: POTRA domain-containing protein [Pirellulaceae bacterium]|nr:POTRA domain-containing protein [Pirellulaceae bacterium]
MAQLICAPQSVRSIPACDSPASRRGQRKLSIFAYALLFAATLTTGCQSLQKPTKSTKNQALRTTLPDGASSTFRLQSPDDKRAVSSAPARPGFSSVPAASESIVADIVVRGNRLVPEHELMRNIQTRPGRYFDPDLLQQDVDRLWRMKEIKRVNGPFLESTPDGLVITLEIVEKQLITSVDFVGNRGISDRQLRKQTGLADGQPLDIHEVRMVKHRIEDFYREKGYPKTQVEIISGSEVGDDRVVFLISEDQQQRVWQVQFEGNAIASDARLRTMIKSKPGVLKTFGGLVQRDEIEQDVLRLVNYYRSLGFFSARIGREVVESNDGRWLTLRFIIDEGPRYRVRSVAFTGNHVFSDEELSSAVQLKPDSNGPIDFNVAKMNRDAANLRDAYGSQGYVFAQVDAEPRFLEEPGLLDLVYRIEEGEQYTVGRINVYIEGDAGVTKRQVSLNRINLRPGDLIDIREIRNAERRLNASQIFGGSDPSLPGSPARIVVRPPEMKNRGSVAQSASTTTR